MANKKAFVFDTNFIIENKKYLNDVIENLKNDYTIYVTQVSIEERIAQKNRELKVRFEEIEECQKKYRDIVQLTMLSNFEEECSRREKETRGAYSFIFKNNIIPYCVDEGTFSTVLNRAYKKTPPFPLNDKSDNGFKDTVLWISLIEYFKNNGEDEIVFVSDDKAFVKNQDMLIEEFKRETNKNIRIETNSYYNELIKADETEKVEEKKEDSSCDELPDVSHLRDRIDYVLYNLCGFDSTDDWGGEYWERRFSLNKEVDASYMKVIFSNLHDDIKNHIFDKNINPATVFDLDDRFSNVNYYVPISMLEEAYRLYAEIKNKFPDYIEQFYLTAARVFNSNHIEPKTDLTNDDLPF